MANFKGSIRSFIQMKGTISKELRLNGTIKKTLTFIGSVPNFVKSLSVRFLLFPRFSIVANSMVLRFLRSNLISKFTISARSSVQKNMIAHITGKVVITANLMVYKYITRTIQMRFIMGYDTTLKVLDPFLLSALDTLTLQEMEFSEGVRMEVIKNILVALSPQVAVEASAITLRYIKLSELDSLTLGYLDNFTLNELDFIET